MSTTQKMVRKKIDIEYSLGVPTYTPEGKFTFEEEDRYVELNILIPEELAGEDKDYELRTWLNQQWEEHQCDCALIHSVYIHEGDS